MEDLITIVKKNNKIIISLLIFFVSIMLLPISSLFLPITLIGLVMSIIMCILHLEGKTNDKHLP